MSVLVRAFIAANPALPSIEEFAELLFRNGEPEMYAAKRKLLVDYARQRACLLGESVWNAIAEAHRVADLCTLSAAELEAEYGR